MARFQDARGIFVKLAKVRPINQKREGHCLSVLSGVPSRALSHLDVRAKMTVTRVSLIEETAERQLRVVCGHFYMK